MTSTTYRKAKTEMGTAECRVHKHEKTYGENVGLEKPRLKKMQREKFQVVKN